MKINTSLIILVASFSVLTVTHAQIYKWKDANGQIHYTETPPQHGTLSELLDQQVKIAAQFLSGKQPQLDEESYQENNSEASNQEESTKTSNTNDSLKSNKSNNQSQNTPYCKKQQKILATLQQNKHIKWKQNDDSFILTEEQRMEKISETQVNLETNCANQNY